MDPDVGRRGGVPYVKYHEIQSGCGEMVDWGGMGRPDVLTRENEFSGANGVRGLNPIFPALQATRRNIGNYPVDAHTLYSLLIVMITCRNYSVAPFPEYAGFLRHRGKNVA